MSGIAGIFNRDGRQPDRSLLDRMTERLADRGPDGIRIELHGPAGLVHCMLHTTPESAAERQPLWDRARRISLTLDGRIDNRSELIATLALAGSGSVTDSELVLSAYQRWGEECAEHLIGDFAFAIWDSRLQRLMCARDPMGVKPFLYRVDGRTFQWASEFRPLLEDPAFAARPNEGMIAELLANAVTNQEETIYRGILQLPPAHILTVDSGECRKRRYWRPDPEPLRYRTDQDYADRFRELFREAVACRLRAIGPVGSDLSGGLDSSSIVAMAAKLLQGASCSRCRFETFSMIFPGLPCDESVFIRDVAAHSGIPSNLVLPREDPAWYAVCAARYRSLPDAPNHHASEPLRARAAARGVRVMLSGEGGDCWFTGTWPPVPTRVRLQAALRECLSVKSLQPIQQRLKARLRGASAAPRWIDPDFARRTRLCERVRPATAPSCRSAMAAACYAQLDSGSWDLSAAVLDRSAARFGFEYRYPFFDTRLVEFAMALPNEQLLRDGTTKLIFRRALGELLPASVRSRRTKAEFSHTLVPALRFCGTFSAVEERSWIDSAAVCRMRAATLRQFDRGHRENLANFWPLALIMAVEMWCRHGYPESAYRATDHLLYETQGETHGISC